MDLHVDDAGFVRAPSGWVYRRLTDVGRWPEWWPGTRVAPCAGRSGTAPWAPVGGRAPLDGDEVWALELAGGWLRRLRLEARLGGWRHDHGFVLELAGDLDGRAEFWLEDTHGGTVVHHLLLARTRRSRPLTVHTDYRRALRRGLWGCKDALQLEARTSAGLPA